MNSSSTVPASPTRPWWLIPVPVLERVVTIVVWLAVVVEAITMSGNAWQGYLALAVSTAALVLVRRAPWVALALAACAPLVAVVLGTDPLLTWNPAVFIAFLLTVRGFPAVLGGVVLGAANFGSQGFFEQGVTLDGNPIAYTAGFAALVAAAVGSALRNQHRYWSALEQQTRDAVANRAAEVRRSVAEERLRIARDLHDSVGHAVAVVSMRLGAAEVQLPPEASGARGELDAARRGVQGVLGEMQQILRVLRVDPGPQTEEVTVEVSALPRLVDGFRAAGVDVVADLGEFHRPLAAPTSVAVYRIVQEALTNAGRHGAGPVVLTVGEEGDDVVVEVVNVPGVRVPGGGHGVVGMRERAASAGGRLDVVADEASFTVRAELPFDGGVPR